MQATNRDKGEDMRYQVAIRYRGLREPLMTASFPNLTSAQEWIERTKREHDPDDYVRCPSGSVLLGKAGRMESFYLVSA